VQPGRSPSASRGGAASSVLDGAPPLIGAGLVRFSRAVNLPYDWEEKPMDPRETLNRLRELCRCYLQCGVDEFHSGAMSEVYDDLQEICELLEALDTWMSAGGFSPWESKF
jgi:hypothetical protein